MGRPLVSYIVATMIVAGVVERGASADRPIGRSTVQPSVGAATYDRYCVACHGELGDGHGPAAPFTSTVPRAFTSGTYKWRTTPLGQPPSDADLRTTIRFGAPGTSMPGFGDVLSAGELDAVIAIVKGFAPAAFAGTPQPLGLGPAGTPNRERGDALWTQAGCVTCHGDTGRGDGAAARTLAIAPYDLTAWPLRRPRARDDADGRRRAAATSIAIGIAGTAMPGYAGQLDEADVWALADKVIALGDHAPPRDPVVLERAQIDADRASPLATAIWPGTGRDAAVWGTHLAPQGPPPRSLAPAEASLSARQCGRCHAKQVREWTGSRHAAAASPGLYAQLDAGMRDTCRRCHAPLAEQAPGDLYQPALRDEGVTCASCHLRGWTRNGPPRVADSLLTAPGYPREERAIYERADFCMPCHQLPPRNAVAGKPLLDTYKEWLEGPYMRRGIQCQHCHMPNREHQWLGIHDRTTFRQGIALEVVARRLAGPPGASVVAELRNAGAGHDLPTTPTPAVWLRIELLDARGTPIPRARGELRIGRDIWFDGTWHERSDTRIPPGAKVMLAKAWRTPDAVAARVTVEVFPDDYYEHFYERKLRDHPAPAIRAQYEQALALARRSRYIAEQRDVALGP